MLIQLVVVLIEVGLGEMDMELSRTRRFGLQNLSDAQRQETLEVLGLLKCAKQVEGSYLKSSGNLYANIISVPVLQKFCDQKHVLTREQPPILDDAEASIRGNMQFCAFINADAGCGKIFMLNTLIACLIHIHRVQVISSEFSGMALTLLLNGRTFQSQFKAELIIGAQRGLDIKGKPKLSECMKRTRFIIIDEGPQLHVG